MGKRSGLVGMDSNFLDLGGAALRRMSMIGGGGHIRSIPRDILVHDRLGNYMPSSRSGVQIGMSICCIICLNVIRGVSSDY